MVRVDLTEWFRRWPVDEIASCGKKVSRLLWFAVATLTLAAQSEQVPFTQGLGVSLGPVHPVKNFRFAGFGRDKPATRMGPLPTAGAE